MVEQLSETFVHPLEDGFGAKRNVEVGCALRERSADQIAHSHARVRRAQVGDQDDAGVAVEREHRRGAAPGGDAPSGVVNEPLRD